MESIDDALQCVGRGVEVVAVELHGKAAAVLVVDGHVPAAADAKVGAFGLQVDEGVLFVVIV